MKSILGKKIGMTQVFDAAGNQVPVTVVEAGPCVVTQLKTVARDGYSAVQLGFGKYLREVNVDKPQEYQVGQEVKVGIFAPGDKLYVTGISIGKGFQGTIKRWHHHRGPMSHGSKSHRIPGSIGAGTTPGRVFKGRKMSGRMGGVQVTDKNLTVIAVEPEKNLVLLKGAVCGKPGNLVKLVKVEK